MAIKRVQKKIDWSPEHKARHKAIRETFKDKPSIDKLRTRGELSGQTLSLGAYGNLRLLVGSLRKMREQANLSLFDVYQEWTRPC